MMFTNGLIIFFLVILSTAWCQIIVPSVQTGIIIPQSRVDACTEVGFKCSDDCQNLLTCLTATGTPEPTLCKDYSPTTPYCDKISNSCVKNLPGGTCAANDNFQCTAEGAFPDPRNCSIFYICAAAGGTGTINECPPGSTYDSKVVACVLPNRSMLTIRTGSSSTNCAAPMVCGKTVPSFVAYKPNPVYYLACVGPKTYMMKCPDDINQYFDGTKCVYDCKDAGNKVDRVDCMKFYQCLKKGSKGTNNTCPTGYIFDPVTFKCIVGTTCTPEITPPTGGAGGAGGAGGGAAGSK